MSQNGVQTNSIEIAILAEEILVNGPNGTSRQSMSAFVQQLLTKSEFSTSPISVPTRADLANLSFENTRIATGVLVTVEETGETFEVQSLALADPDLSFDVPLNIVPQINQPVAFEALDDGRDHNTLFARAIGKFHSIVLASAITLTSPIMVQSDIDLQIDGGNISYAGEGVMMRQDGDVNIRIQGKNGGYVTGPDNTFLTVAQMGYKGLVEIDGLITFNIHPYATGTGIFSYATVTEADMVGGIRLNNIIATCSTGASTAAAITLRYTDGAWLSNIEIHGYRHGIQWWGGDSNPAENGAFANERKCRNIYIDNCQVYDASSTSAAYSGGGFWGSMGELIFLTRCHAEGCHDVGIDFEGCFNSSATNCTARDNQNGNYTTFFICRTVTFENSFSFQRYGKAHFRAYNSSLNPENQRRISLINMHYEAFDGGDGETGFPTIDTNNGPVDGLRLIGGTYVNSVIKIAVSNSTNGGAVEIRDPYFEISVVPEHSSEDPFTLVYCKGMSVGWFHLSGLKVRAYVAIPSGAYLADVRGTDYSKPITFVFEDINDADLTSGRNFTGGIRFTAVGANSGVHPIVFLRNIRCALMSIVNTGVGTANVTEYNNYSIGGGVLTTTVT